MPFFDDFKVQDEYKWLQRREQLQAFCRAWGIESPTVILQAMTAALEQEIEAAGGPALLDQVNLTERLAQRVRAILWADQP